MKRTADVKLAETAKELQKKSIEPIALRRY